MKATATRRIDIDECAKMIRAALKQGFPKTKFSVRKTRSTYDHNIDVRWTDGPTSSQVKPILDRFVSKGFDGMTDCGYYCGNRVLNGEQVEVSGNYVTGTRQISKELRMRVASKLANECGLDQPELSEWGNLKNDSLNVPFMWHSHWEEKLLTLEDFESRKHVLVNDSHNGEWFSTLVYRVESSISLEAQQPISADLLPEYIKIDETVSTGRAEEFEPRQPMFEGHAAYNEHADETETKAIESFESAPVALVPVVENAPSVQFNCKVGRSYAAPAATAPAVEAIPIKPEPQKSVCNAAVTENTEKNGVEIRFPEKPAENIIESLKANGWRWSRFAGCWYQRKTDKALHFANSLVMPQAVSIQ